MSRKIKSTELRKIMPRLEEIAKLPSKRVSERILSSSNKTQDLICKCVSIGLKNLDETNFKKKHMSSLQSQKEFLRFIRSYSLCSRAKKKCLVHKRSSAIKKTGRGIGLIISALLPFLTSILAKAFKL